MMQSAAVQSGQTVRMTAADARIVGVYGREILDSRGYPTVEAEVHLACGVRGFAAAPAGASTGSGEAVELRDGGKRVGGRGVRRAAAHINGDIAKALCGTDSCLQQQIDDMLTALDAESSAAVSTDSKTGKLQNIGANAVLAVSLAAAKAAASCRGVPLYQHLADIAPTDSSADVAGRLLPAPMMNILNGGAHATNNVDVQEFMVMPLGFDNFGEALFAGADIFHALKAILHTRGLATAVGDEGGFAPDLRGASEALDLLMEAIARAGYRAGQEVYIALDCAASELYRDGVYGMPSDNFRGDGAAMADWLSALCKQYPIVSIEDGCAESDWQGWRQLTKQLGDSVQLVGDDLFVTDCALLQKGMETGAANALLAKPNQIGTLTATQQAVAMAQGGGYAAVVSHRSGETEYDEIADMAVGWAAGQIKTGAPCRGERTAKYNRLLRIAESLGAAAEYAGLSILRGRR